MTGGKELEELGVSLLLRGALGTSRSPQPRPEPLESLLPVSRPAKPPPSAGTPKCGGSPSSTVSDGGSRDFPEGPALGTPRNYTSQQAQRRGSEERRRTDAAGAAGTCSRDERGGGTGGALASQESLPLGGGKTLKPRGRRSAEVKASVGLVGSGSAGAVGSVLGLGWLSPRSADSRL